MTPDDLTRMLRAAADYFERRTLVNRGPHGGSERDSALRSIRAAADLLERSNTSDDLTSRAQGEAERRWPREGRPTTNAGHPVTPQGWLDEGMASGFMLGAQWAAAQAPSAKPAPSLRQVGRNEAPSVEALTAERDVARRNSQRWLAERDALAARIDRLREGIEGLFYDDSALLPAGHDYTCSPGCFATHPRGVTLDSLRALLAEDEGEAGEWRTEHGLVRGLPRERYDAVMDSGPEGPR